MSVLEEAYPQLTEQQIREAMANVCSSMIRNTTLTDVVEELFSHLPAEDKIKITMCMLEIKKMGREEVIFATELAQNFRKKL